MKNEAYETIGIIVSFLGAWVRSWADKLGRRETVVNLIFGVVLGFGMSFLFEWLSGYMNTLTIFAILFSVGYVGSDYTAKLRLIVHDIYSIVMGLIKELGQGIVDRALLYLDRKSKKKPNEKRDRKN